MPTAIETVKRWLNGPNGDEMKENTPLDSRPFSAFSASSAPQSPENWPQPLAEQAFYGLPGDIVRTIEPHTEADPAALAKALEVTPDQLLDEHETKSLESLVREVAR